MEIPRGGDDVIARRIYRTVNTGETKTDKSFYYLDTVLNNVDEIYHDVRQDPALGSSVPLDSASIRFPARSPRFCAVYSSCLFLDGGEGEDTRLYYSNPLKPDQFSALDFLEVSSRKGGGIRGLISYFNFLIVLRESSVDVVSGTYPNFQLKTILSGIGSTAVNSAATIPELGIVFATFDGVYLFAGNLEYSDKPEVVKLSDPISKTWLRVNRDQLARSAGAYSHKHKEYHLYVCRDGSAVPNIGLVYSMVKRSWSVRSGFPVGCIDTDGQGNLIFGHHTGASAGADSPAGLFVISARRALGVTKSGDGVVDGSPPVWKFRSPWLDFGDPQIKKKVHHVTLYVLTTGSNAVTMTVYKDFSSSGTAAGSKIMQRTDYTDQPRYDFNLLDNPGTVWNDQLLTEIRWDVHTGAASHFLFEVSGTTDILLVGYAVDYTASNMKIIRGRSS